MLKGIIEISSNPEYCYNTSLTIPNTKILSLEEEDDFIELSSQNPNVIKGTILLPPIEANWAEVEGDLQRFSTIYNEYLYTREVSDFIYTLIGYLYNGGRILIYCPDVVEANMSASANYIQYLYNFFDNDYGLHIATGNTNPFLFNINYAPSWLSGIYLLGIITPYDFLQQYPKNIDIIYPVLSKLILDIKPYGTSFNEQAEYIKLLHKGNNNSVAALKSI